MSATKITNIGAILIAKRFGPKWTKSRPKSKTFLPVWFSRIPTWTRSKSRPKSKTSFGPVIHYLTIWPQYLLHNLYQLKKCSHHQLPKHITHTPHTTSHNAQTPSLPPSHLQMHLNVLPKERLPTALKTSKEPALHSIFFFSSLWMMLNNFFKTQSDYLLV